MKVLLLAGTAEARALAARLAGDARVDLTVSLAGVTTAPLAHAGQVRHGGFGGAAGFEAYMRGEGIAAVIDATHPFARVMPGRAARVAAGLGAPYLRLLRPAWVAGDGEDWVSVPDEATVADAVPPRARVFLATGGRSLERYTGLSVGRYVIARVIDQPDGAFPFEHGEWIVGRPPFSVDQEIAALRETRAEVLVTKNAGGPTRAKLDAAQALSLPVFMIERPSPPDAPQVETVEDALHWLEALP